MTEEQLIAAIEALGVEFYCKIKHKNWYTDHPNDQESLIHATVTALRVLHTDGNLNAKDVYEFMITGFWHNATEVQKFLCDNAVQAMKEIIAKEKSEAI